MQQELESAMATWLKVLHKTSYFLDLIDLQQRLPLQCRLKRRATSVPLRISLRATEAGIAI